MASTNEMEFIAREGSTEKRTVTKVEQGSQTVPIDDGVSIVSGNFTTSLRESQSRNINSGSVQSNVSHDYSVPPETERQRLEDSKNGSEVNHTLSVRGVNVQSTKESLLSMQAQRPEVGDTKVAENQACATLKPEHTSGDLTIKEEDVPVASAGEIVQFCTPVTMTDGVKVGTSIFPATNESSAPLIESVLKIEIKVEDKEVQDLYVPTSVLQMKFNQGGPVTVKRQHSFVPTSLRFYMLWWRQGKTTFSSNGLAVYNTTVIGTLDKEMSRAVETAVNLIANGFQVGKTPEILLQKYSCDVCRESFPDEDRLNEHKKCHEATEKNLFPCEFCGKVMHVKSKLLVHRRNHTGEKPFKCEFCNSVFSRNSSLNRHRKCHTGNAVYKCEKCNLMLDYSQYTAHRKLHATNKQCSVCSKAFVKHSDLVRHFRTHTGEKPHICDVCGRGFSDKSHLTTHRRIHTGERPYKCDVCKKAFLKNSDLVRHKKVHAAGRSSYCDICGSSFHSNFLMLNHKLTHSTTDRLHKCGVCGKEQSQNSDSCDHTTNGVPVNVSV